MAKFIKSIFHTGERRKSRYEEEEEKPEASPPLDDRRKLSISRSGRMKANKKRLSLSLEVYGQELQKNEKPKTIEYNVASEKEGAKKRQSQEITPEEEIDHAFEVIEKT